MKKIIYIAAVLSLLVSTNQVSAQLVIRNNGHAEIGTNPNANDADASTVLKIFGDEVNTGAGAKIAFGDTTNVTVGELGTTNTDRLWMHGKDGLYFTAGTIALPVDTIAFYDQSRASEFRFNVDLNAAGIFVQSDERYKENIKPIDDVLESLSVLEPVSYNLKRQRMASNRPINDGSERYGFLAQNVQEVFPELVHTDNNGYLSVDYIGLIPILVESINELRTELNAVKAEKQELESAAATFNAPLQSGNDELTAATTAAKLYQNAPNPWSSETVIRYRLPQDVATACIYIYDMQGAQLKCIPAQGRGESQVTLTAHDLKAGMYIYALVADGALIDSKQMILTK